MLANTNQYHWLICCPSIPVHARGFTSEQRLLCGAGLNLSENLGGDPLGKLGNIQV